MNCTEVGELMQRHLDYDLDESELEVLMTHLSDCSQCTELFEKLTLLSGSLEQLPRVTPSISIVDTILPELEMIDRAKAQDVRRAVVKRNRIWTTIGSIGTAAAIVLLMVNLGGKDPLQSTSSNVAMDRMNMIADTDDTARSLSDASSVFKMAGDIAESFDEERLGNRQIVPTTSFTNKKFDPSDLGQSNSAAAQEEFNMPVEGLNGTATEGPIVSEDPPLTNDATVPLELEEVASSDLPESGLLEIASNDEKLDEPKEMAIQQVEKYFSMDEKLYVLIDAHSIVVFETSTDRIVQQWEVTTEERYLFVSWDKNGTSFTTQALDDTGKMNNYTWIITEK